MFIDFLKNHIFTSYFIVSVNNILYKTPEHIYWTLYFHNGHLLRSFCIVSINIWIYHIQMIRDTGSGKTGSWLQSWLSKLAVQSWDKSLSSSIKWK